MSIKQLSDFIKEHKNGKVPYPYGDDFIVSHHVRGVLREHIHITEETVYMPEAFGIKSGKNPNFGRIKAKKISIVT